MWCRWSHRLQSICILLNWPPIQDMSSAAPPQVRPAIVYIYTSINTPIRMKVRLTKGEENIPLTGSNRELRSPLNIGGGIVYHDDYGRFNK